MTTSATPTRWARRWWILPPLGVGIAIMTLFTWKGKTLPKTPLLERSRVLRVIEVPEIDVIPRALGYGTAEPGRIWRAVAEVAGKVVDVHPQLQSGAIFQAGESILRIDPTEYQLTVKRLEAEVAQLEAQLSQLNLQKANYEASLTIEATSLTLAEKELERSRGLAAKNALAKSAVDQNERDVLTQQQRVQEMRNALRVIPAEIAAAKASLAAKQASLAEARLDLAKTEITAPFAFRATAVKLETGQYLAAQELLFEGHAIRVTEVEAQVPLEHMRRLIPSEARLVGTAVPDRETIQKLLDLDVLIRTSAGGITAEWEGRFSRLREQLDARTRTLGVVVAVDDPYQKAIPGKRPPLIQGMFCEVELRGRVRQNQLLVPRSALYGTMVYRLNEANRLEKTAVEVAFVQSNFASIRHGLRQGDRVIVTDPTPAIEGLLVEPITDTALVEQLLAAASGTEAAR